MSFDPSVIAAFASGNIGTRVFLIDFEFDSGTLRFTTIPDGKTYNGETYSYLGALGSVGVVEESSELDPAEYQVVIGSADTTILATFLSEPSLNRKITCYQALIDDSQNFIESTTDAGPWLYFRGSMQPASINDGASPTILVPVKDELADWDRSITSLYTDAEQRRLHPDDFCLENVSQIAARNVIWPTAKLLEAQS